MLTQSAFIVAALFCASTLAVPFDPYSRRYDVCKNSMNDLLVTPPGKTRCTYVQGLLDLSTKASFTSAQNATFSAWVQTLEASIIMNASYSTNEQKFMKLSSEMKKFQLEQSVIYTKVQWLNISSWGPVDTVVRVTQEWTFESSLELILPTSTKGNCKLFDLLLEACDDDADKKSAMKAFIESNLMSIVKDKTKTQKECIVAINKELQTNFFVGAQASWMAYFGGKDLKGFNFNFGQWCDAAVVFQRQVDITVTLSGQGLSCPFILSLNASLSSTAYTNTQKGFIKQLMNYFIQQFSTLTTAEERADCISKKFSESIDLSYTYFSCLNSITIQGFGGCWWDLIVLGCQGPKIPQDCGCTKPPLTDETTVAPTTVAASTEMPTSTVEGSTEMPSTVEGSTEFSTEATPEVSGSTDASTWDSTFSSITFPSSTAGCSCTCEY